MTSPTPPGPPEPLAASAPEDHGAAAALEAEPPSPAVDTPPDQPQQPIALADAPPSPRQRASAEAINPAPPTDKVPVPNLRRELSPELELELQEALGGLSLEEVISARPAEAAPPELAPETRVRGRVVKLHRGEVFVDLGGPHQGVVPLGQFAEGPQLGAVLDLVVSHVDPEEGLYALSLPGAAVAVADWSELAEGLVVEARVTAVNKGGLECEVNHLRGFIPAGQASLYRVDDLAELVGQKLACVVTECNPQRRNLVLSRRAVLEREKEEARRKLLTELAPGQVREGVVRSIRDFGAFVDLGGVDGLLHVSQLSWARVNHPSDVLKQGQTVTVKVQKIDPQTGKISLAMRELTESPWTRAAEKFPVGTRHTGTVSKLMEFGAFVQLEPGIEGLVHISELAHKRVVRSSDVVSEGQQVDVQVLSVDAEKQRIGLSIKALISPAAPVRPQQEPEEDAPPPPSKRPSKPLRGGLGRSAGGDQFGLNW